MSRSKRDLLPWKVLSAPGRGHRRRKFRDALGPSLQVKLFMTFDELRQFDLPDDADAAGWTLRKRLGLDEE